MGRTQHSCSSAMPSVSLTPLLTIVPRRSVCTICGMLTVHLIFRRSPLTSRRMQNTQQTDTPSDVSRPRVLTIGMVVDVYSHELKAAIRPFLNESVEDAYPAIILHLITPYESTGKTPLEGYDPDRASPGAFLFTVATNVLNKRHNKQKRREELAPMVGIISHNHGDSARVEETSDGDISDNVIAGLVEPDVDIYAFSMSDIAHNMDGTEHAKVLRVSASGEQVSTKRMLELFVFDDRSLTEIADTMGVSQSDVRRRFARLKAEPWALTMKAHRVAS